MNLVVGDGGHVDIIRRAIQSTLRNRLLKIVGSKVILNRNILGVGGLVGVGSEVHNDIVIILIFLGGVVGHMTLVVGKVVVADGREGNNPAKSHLRNGSITLLVHMSAIQKNTYQDNAYTKKNELMCRIHLFTPSNFFTIHYSSYTSSIPSYLVLGLSL
jgi:hypothetical protein